MRTIPKEGLERLLAALSEYPEGTDLNGVIGTMERPPHSRTLLRWMKKLHSQRKIYVRGRSTATLYFPRPGRSSSADRGSAGSAGSANVGAGAAIADSKSPPTAPHAVTGNQPATNAAPAKQAGGLSNNGPQAIGAATGVQASSKPMSGPEAGFPAMTGDDNADAVALTGYIARVTLPKSAAVALVNQLAARRSNPPGFAATMRWHLRRLDTTNCAEYGASQEQTSRLDALWRVTPGFV